MAIFTATELTQQVNQTYVQSNLISLLFFVDSKPSKGKFVEVHTQKSGRQIAPYVNPIVSGVVMKKQGKRRDVFEPPMVKPKVITLSEDALNETSIFYGDGLDAEDRAIAQIDKDQEELKQMVGRQKELQAVAVATKGKFTAKGEGVEEEFDYGMDDDATESLLDTAQWSDPASKPLQDLEDWQEEIFDKTGKTPDVVVMGKEAHSAFKTHESVQKLFDKNNILAVSHKPVNLTDEEGNKVEGAGYSIYIEYLDVHVYKYNATFEDAEGNSVQVFPSKMVLMGVSGGGHFAYGAIANRKHLGNELFVGEIFVKSDFDNADNEIIEANAKPLAVPEDIDGFKAVTVLEEE